jgi:hypothetical protein
MRISPWNGMTQWKTRFYGVSLAAGRMRKLLAIVFLITACAGSAAAQSLPGAVTAKNFEQIRFADNPAYANIQAAINDAPAGGQIWVPPGTYAQGTAAISITGKQLLCAPGANITFSGLNAGTDAVTMGWSDDTTRTGIEGCVFSMNASGQDAIRSDGGNNWYIHRVTIQDQGRDCIHVEPDVNFHWSENSDVEDVHCSFTVAKAGTVRDGINISLGNSALTNVFINKGTWSRINIRGYKSNGIHILANNGCAGCFIGTHLFTQIEADAQVGVANVNPAVFFEKGASGTANEIANISFAGGDFEDTSGAPVAASVFKQSAGVLNGLFVLGAIDGNYPQIYDTSIVAGSGNNCGFSTMPDALRAFCPVQFMKDGSGLQQVAWAMSIPGNATGNDAILSIFNSGAWAARYIAHAVGGHDFNNSAGTLVAQIDNGGNFHTLEGAAPTGTAGQDVCGGNSTSHTLQCNFNNGATFSMSQTIASGTFTLGTGAIASNTCAAVVRVAGTGILTTDTISWAFNADPNTVTGYGAGATGALSVWVFPTSGNANVRVCNLNAGNITPAAATLNWRVTR